MSLNKERFEAKTVEEAITNATVSLGITSDELENQDETGLFYLNNKSAKKLKTITEEEHVTFETPVFLKEQYI